jgi:hypothetical protein
MTVGHIGSFVNVLNKFLEALLSDEDAIGLEQTGYVQTVAVMPNDSLEVPLSTLKVLVAVLASYDTDNCSLIFDLIDKD